MTTVTYDVGLRTLPLDVLRPSALNPRRHTDPKALEELTESIRRVGLLTPLLVRPSVNSLGLFEIAAGHRRLAAAKKAGLEQVPVVIRAMTDTEFLEAITIENLQREDIHPLDEGLGYRTLMEKAHYDVAAIAAKVGKSVSYIYQRLKLAELIPPAQKAFLEDKITAGHAILMARLQPKDQQAALKEVFQRRWDDDGDGAVRWTQQAISVRELARWIESNVHLDLHAAPWKKDDATLVPAAGPCTTCPKRTGNTPQLFPDIAKKDTCTDPTCYAAKMAAHLARLKEQTPNLVQLSESWSHKAKIDTGKPIPRPLWDEAKPGSCKHVAHGVLVANGRRSGHVITVCFEPKCRVHREEWELDRPARAARDQAARKASDRAAKQRMEVRRRMLRAITEKVTRLDRQDLELVATGAFSGLWHEYQKQLVKLHDWDPQKRYGGWNFEAPVAKAVRTLTDANLARFLLEIVLIKDVASPHSYHSGEGKWLAATARRYKVNTAAIERAVKAEQKAAAAKRRTKGKKR